MDDTYPKRVSDPAADGIPEYADDDSTAYDDVRSSRAADGPDPYPLPPDRDDGPAAIDEYGTTPEEQRRGEPMDLRLSREALEARLGERVRTVAYPWGKLGRHVNDETFAAAQRAGFELGLISLPRALRERDDPLRLPRLGVGAEPVERLVAKVRGEIDWHAYVHEHVPAMVARRVFPEYAGA